jgi:methylenetetrahydrofolate dehydrogenase (NADP+)/methenyltetrahydrofolate cyclohydrolase
MLIDGRAIAHELNLNTKRRIEQLSYRPLLVDIVIGNDPVSLSYVKIKQKRALEIGLAFQLHHLSSQVTTQEVIFKITELSVREELCGLIIQLPLPPHLDTKQIVNAIPQKVDVDLLSSLSSEKFYKNESLLIPPTAGAILQILDSLPEDWHSKKFLVLGQGELVGKPVTHLLKKRGYDVSVADSATTGVNEMLLAADCVISGVGQPGLVTGDKLKHGVIVIDAGTAETGGAIVGDVDQDSVKAKAKFLTPVPGGVGPITVAKLLENVLLVAEINQGLTG